MKILLVNQNKMVEKLFENIARKLALELIVQEHVDEALPKLQEGGDYFFFADDTVVDEIEYSKIEAHLESCKLSAFIHRKTIIPFGSFTHYIQKPFLPTDVLHILERTIEALHLHAEEAEQSQETPAIADDDMVFGSDSNLSQLEELENLFNAEAAAPTPKPSVQTPEEHTEGELKKTQEPQEVIMPDVPEQAQTPPPSNIESSDATETQITQKTMDFSLEDLLPVDNSGNIEEDAHEELPHTQEQPVASVEESVAPESAAPLAQESLEEIPAELEHTELEHTELEHTELEHTELEHTEPKVEVPVAEEAQVASSLDQATQETPMESTQESSSLQTGSEALAQPEAHVLEEATQGMEDTPNTPTPDASLESVQSSGGATSDTELSSVEEAELSQSEDESTLKSQEDMELSQELEPESVEDSTQHEELPPQEEAHTEEIATTEESHVEASQAPSHTQLEEVDSTEMLDSEPDIQELEPQDIAHIEDIPGSIMASVMDEPYEDLKSKDTDTQGAVGAETEQPMPLEESVVAQEVTTEPATALDSENAQANSAEKVVALESSSLEADPVPAFAENLDATSEIKAMDSTEQEDEVTQNTSDQSHAPATLTLDLQSLLKDLPIDPKILENKVLSIQITDKV
ncbi:hypothetical protein ACFOPX_07305 [Helicobacter baculiformis]|uniref:Poly E-rich protein n=1 Tax=Helicobacter baculiformis TaxID=427351 RepID=A0ABV7ZIE0_9HELI|nr:hypothetical protein [Helicobacter baculiformis]